MKTIVRFNDETGQFEIVRVEYLENDGFRIDAVIQTFPEGTTNAEACKAYDEWAKMQVAKDGNLRP